jgi:hypothetical protein
MMKNKGKGIDSLNQIKQKRSYKLKTINSIEIVREELEKLKLTYTLDCELFVVTVKSKEFSIQIDSDCIMCWTNLSEYKSFNLCQYGLDVEEFVCQLENIVDDFNKLFKLKDKIDKKISEIENLIESSDICGIQLNDSEIDGYLLFENLIYSDEI